MVRESVEVMEKRFEESLTEEYKKPVANEKPPSAVV